MEAAEALRLAEESLASLQRLLREPPPGGAAAGLPLAVARAVGPVRGVVAVLRALAADEPPVEWCAPAVAERSPLELVREGGAWEQTELALFGRRLLGRVRLGGGRELRLLAAAQRDRDGEAWAESFEVEEVAASGEPTLLGGWPTLAEALGRLRRRLLAPARPPSPP